MRLAHKTLLAVVLAGTAGAQHPVSGQVTGPDGKPVADAGPGADAVMAQGAFHLS